MKNAKWSILGLVVAATLVACDPYEDENSDEPRIAAVTATSGTDAFVATAAGTNAFAVSAQGTCDEDAGDPTATPPVPPSPTFGSGLTLAPIVFVTFNKQMDPLSVQTSPANCAPTSTVAVTPVTAGFDPLQGSTWYACYTPATVQSGEGGSAVFFPGDPAAPAEGWSETGTLVTDADADVTYRIAYTVNDQQGRSVPFTVDVTHLPNPGHPGDPTIAVSATPVLTWTASPCATANTRYMIERAPNVPGTAPIPDEPGDFAEIGRTTTAGETTFTDSVGGGPEFWYRVTSVAPTGNLGDTSGEVQAVP